MKCLPCWPLAAAHHCEVGPAVLDGKRGKKELFGEEEDDNATHGAERAGLSDLDTRLGKVLIFSTTFDTSHRCLVAEGVLGASVYVLAARSVNITKSNRTVFRFVCLFFVWKSIDIPIFLNTRGH